MKRANPQLPAAPIQKRLDATRRSLSLTWDEFADYLGVSKRTLLRTMASSTLGIIVADRISIRLGLHPAVVWPLEWSEQSPGGFEGSFPNTSGVP